jgi:hypothetical protein
MTATIAIFKSKSFTSFVGTGAIVIRQNSAWRAL